LREQSKTLMLNAKIFFMEPCSHFNRFDIVRRVVEYSKYTGIESIHVILLYAEPNIMIIRRGLSISLNLDDPFEYLISELQKCRNIILLTESGNYDIALLTNTECFLAGLHTDIPDNIIAKIEREKPLNRVKLSNVPYQAQTLLAVIDIYASNNPKLRDVVSNNIQELRCG